MIWECKIGDADPEVAIGIDLPMRQVIAATFLALTGKNPDYIFSGWHGSLTKGEQEVVDGYAARTP